MDFQQSSPDLAPELGSLPNAHAVATSRRVMPDIAAAPHALEPSTLDRVGMSHIEVPVRILDATGAERLVPGEADAYVSLDDPHAKGIHMSRLFLALQEGLEERPLDVATLRSLTERFVASHEGLSGSAQVTVRYPWMVRRPALRSRESGWRTYPVAWRATRDTRGVEVLLTTTVTYSSTCPCSAALARQLIQEAFDARFAGAPKVEAASVRRWLGTTEGIVATPHSQRSTAEVTVALAPAVERFMPEALIDAVEGSLTTAVQAAVKREDEQAFALLNGQNQMFCEDAARRVRAALEADDRVADYRVEIRHAESLHPHDAVAIFARGLPGGLRV